MSKCCSGKADGGHCRRGLQSGKNDVGPFLGSWLKVVVTPHEFKVLPCNLQRHQQ